MKRISLYARNLREKRDGLDDSSSLVASVAHVLLVSLTIHERRFMSKSGEPAVETRSVHGSYRLEYIDSLPTLCYPPQGIIVHDGSLRDRRAESKGLAPPSSAVPVPLPVREGQAPKRRAPVPNSTMRVRGAKACRSNGSAIAAEALMNNAAGLAHQLDA